MIKSRFFCTCVLLLVGGTLLFSACSTGSSSHMTYGITYAPPSSSFASSPGDQYITVYAASQSTLTWKRNPAGVSDEALPKKILITAKLMGPFPSYDDAHRALGRSSSGVSAITPIQTDDWSKDTLTANLHLPQTPGYYLLIQSESDGPERNSIGATYVIRVISKG